MIYYSPSKVRDLTGVYTVQSSFDINSGRPYQTSAKEVRQSFVNSPGDYSRDAEDLRWDEYGNPYISTGRF